MDNCLLSLLSRDVLVLVQCVLPRVESMAKLCHGQPSRRPWPGFVAQQSPDRSASQES